MLNIFALSSFLWLPLAVSAQIVASCNPVLTTSCSANPALATSFIENFNDESEYFDAAAFKDRISYSDDGVSLTLAERFDNPSLKSKFYIMFGKLEIILKAAPGRGVVSSFYLQSDDLDEIDLEWVGSDITEVQTNYFSKGNVTTYDRGAFHPVSDPQNQYHNYTIDWTKDALSWYVDGVAIRTLPADSPSGYPQSPMYVVMGIWAGGDPSNQPGTIQWAGGLTDYTQAPFTMHVKNLIVTDYSTGSEYSYGDQSGTWQSIEAAGGSVNGRISQGQEEFAILASGGEIDSDSNEDDDDENENESSSNEQPTASSSSSSETKTTSQSTESSSKSSEHGGLESSKARVSTVYSSAATSLVSRSTSGRSQVVLSSSTKSSSAENTVFSSAASLLSSSVADSTSITTSSTGNTTGATTPSSSFTTISSGTTTSSVSNSQSPVSSSTIIESNSGNSVVISIGGTGLKALFVSTILTGSLLFLL